jgi:glucose/arabinose dehydrogenase
MTKRFLILLIVPLLIACGTNQTAAPTSLPATILPAATESAPTEIPAPRSFPNAESYQWEMILAGLSRPVDIQFIQGKMFIVEKHGTIRVVENGQLREEPFLNIVDRVNDKGNEMGLLGLAFHPDYSSNGFFYVNYTGAGGNTRISRFQANDPNSEKILLTVNQPYQNHNGGVLAFGPDGYLYAGLGDGGSAGDPYKNGQNTQVLLGKILRIDVNNGDPYSIPSDNPFGNEVWAYGLRNPWRMSFDRMTGDLWIGDVGQGKWEEVDYLPKGQGVGANFGWSVVEGNHNYDGEMQPVFLLPVAEYSHAEGCSITGGYVYRGAMTEWDGIYLYADYCSGKVWGLMLVDGVWQNKLLFETGELITTFGQDEFGEIYFASDRGGIYLLAKR